MFQRSVSFSALRLSLLFHSRYTAGTRRVDFENVPGVYPIKRGCLRVFLLPFSWLSMVAFSFIPSPCDSITLKKKAIALGSGNSQYCFMHALLMDRGGRPAIRGDAR